MIFVLQKKKLYFGWKAHICDPGKSGKCGKQAVLEEL